MKPAKIKAFTIMEVTITMLIAAILMGIIYTAYSIISRSYQSFHIKNKEMAEVNQLDKLLKKDFDRAEIIEKTADGVMVINSGNTVIYEFRQEAILRTAVLTDTFKVKPDSLSALFEGQPLDEIRSSDESNRIDELSFSLLLQNEKIPYHYLKLYSSVNLIQRHADALH